MRVAIIHDWLVGMRGGERVLEALIPMFQEVDIYSAFYEPSQISKLINDMPVYPSCFQRLPRVQRYYRYLLPLYPVAAGSLSRKLSQNHKSRPYNLVLSVSHCLAKAVEAPPGVPHISYCLTPMRYIWDQYEAYFLGSKVEPLIRQAVRRLRSWDVSTAGHVSQFVAISDFVRLRIERVYAQEAKVIFPPVSTNWITPRRESDSGSGFLCVSALVPYKNVDVIVRAFDGMSEKLTVVGSGPEKSRLQSIAGDNVEFLENISRKRLAKLYSSAEALVFAAEEDFGMVAVEAQAAGRPVICYGRGGVLETVIGEGVDQTGVYFNQLNPSAIQHAIGEFRSKKDRLTLDNCLKQGLNFSLQRFHAEFFNLLASHPILHRDYRPGSLEPRRRVGERR